MLLIYGEIPVGGERGTLYVVLMMVCLQKFLVLRFWRISGAALPPLYGLEELFEHDVFRVYRRITAFRKEELLLLLFIHAAN